MADRFFAIDDTTFLFPDEVRDAYLDDIQGKLDTAVTGSVAAMPAVAAAVASTLAPLTADTAVAPLVTGSTTTRTNLDNRYQVALIVPVDSTGTTDYTTLIQAALNSGRDVIIVGTGSSAGVAKTTATLVTKSTAYGQRFETRNASIQPAFVGDVVQMTTRADLRVQIRGTLQPAGTYTNVAGIRIGGTVNNWNPQHGSVAYSEVLQFKGSAVIWDQGSMIDFTHFHADTITIDGIRCTYQYDDNNHGNFANTHVVNAAGIGYAIYGDGSNLANGGSRHHVFTGAKAFGCGQNYLIQTRSNEGTIFSELSGTPSTTTVNSRGNSLKINETAAEYEGWIDAGQGNEISGYDGNNAWSTKKSITRVPTLGTTTFTEVKNGQYTVPSTLIGPGASVVLTPGVNGLGTGRVVYATYFGLVGNLDVSAYIDASGGLHFLITNTFGTAQTISGTISYLIWRFA